MFVMVETELRSHSAWRTDDETPLTTNRPSQLGIQQISRTDLSATHATPTIRKSPRCDMENNKNSSSRLPFSNSKTTSKTTREATTNHKHRTNLRSETEKHNNHVETCRKSPRKRNIQCQFVLLRVMQVMWQKIPFCSV